MPSTLEATTETPIEDRQYAAWGVAIQTSNVRPAHIANGVVQLLRLAGSAPPWRDLRDGVVAGYLERVRQAFGGWPSLPPATRGLCVVKTKRGPLLLAVEGPADPPFMAKARAHLRGRLRDGLPEPDQQRLLAGAVNADGRVAESGASDPTTPGLQLAGVTSPQTLRGMHAATFLGLLSATASGRQALAGLYALLASTDDSHSALVDALGLAQTNPLGFPWPARMAADALESAYPLPVGEDWRALAVTTGEMALRLLGWQTRGASKPETLMAFIDLAALVLVLRLLRWAVPERLLLLVSPEQVTSHLRQAIVRAQQSLQVATSALDATAAARGLVTGRYRPGLPTLNLGAAGGWLFPLDSRGGARRYLRPGARQLATLVRCLLAPGEEAPFREVARRAEALGLAIGGPGEHQTAQRLQIGGVADTLRRVGAANQDHLVALGLARREADNVVIVDGGAS
jgi:hypothetical protein